MHFLTCLLDRHDNHHPLILSYNTAEAHLVKFVTESFKILEKTRPIQIIPNHHCPDIFVFRNAFPPDPTSVLLYLDGEKSLEAALFGNLYLHPFLIYLGPSTGVPFASQHFTERSHTTLDDPTLLFVSSSIRAPGPRQKDVAFLAFNCQPQRDAAVQRLNLFLHGRVDALGRCGRGADSHATERSRYAKSYLDDAVDHFRPYKVVLAFENDAAVDGYVTEKIVNAFLAGAVPVYFGHKSVFNTFNEGSFIFVDELEGQEWMERVRAVLEDGDLFEKYRSIPPLKDSWMFSWHPKMRPDNRLSLELSAILSRKVIEREELLTDKAAFEKFLQRQEIWMAIQPTEFSS